MKLVIVESSAKIKSIEKFLGSDYKVIASMGHIRELREKPGYGFNLKTLDPYWELVQKAKNGDNLEQTVDEIKTMASKADIVYLATDPDREGEAISWHIYDILDDNNKEKCQRITFNEITKNAITNAIKEPRDIDMNLVHSQFGRRYLDRVVGYDLSNLVKSKLRATSAGRVQSVALLFIVERWKEVQQFIPRYWWTINGSLKGKGSDIKIFLRKIDAEKEILCFDETKKSEDAGSEFKFKYEDDAKFILNKLGPKYKVYGIDDPIVYKNKTYVPFTTDTLLTMAFNKLDLSTAKITQLANELYSGVEIDGVMTSLISYPRTDINRLNEGFIADLRKYIADEFGDEYVNKNAKEAKVTALVQGAHEGIRPIDIRITPQSLQNRIKTKNESDKKDALRLYNLIWNITIASFMNPPKYNRYVIRFENNKQKFYTTYSRLLFNGYLVLPSWEETKKDSQIDLSYLKVGDELEQTEPFTICKHQTEPPGLFNEGSLIKALKEEGVGRPSTYGTMIKIVKDRGYVHYKNKKLLEPTEKGIVLIDNLTRDCGEVISKKYTAKMETQLDQIAEGKEDWKVWFREFFDKFKLIVNEAKQNMQKLPPKIFNDHKCPKCGGVLIYKEKKFGKTEFIGCSNYQHDGTGCNYTESIVDASKNKPELIDRNCPECSMQLIKRYNRKNQPFIACTGFPKCHYIESLNTTKPKTTKNSSKKETKN